MSWVGAAGSVTYSIRQSGTTFIVNLNVGSRRATIAIPPTEPASR